MSENLPSLPTTSQSIRTFEQSLPAGLNALVTTDTPLMAMDLISPDERSQIEPMIKGYQKRLAPADPAWIEAELGMLAVMLPSAKISEREASARIAAYLEDISDLSGEALAYAFRECRRTCEFFPTVAVIRKAAQYPMNMVLWKINRLQFMADRFDREYQAPSESESVDEAEVAAILFKLGIKRATVQPTAKSYEDYLAMGLTPDEARQCVEQAKSEGRIAA